jgi:hypothetical protein
MTPFGVGTTIINSLTPATLAGIAIHEIQRMGKTLYHQGTYKSNSISSGVIF